MGQALKMYRIQKQKKELYEKFQEQVRGQSLFEYIQEKRPHTGKELISIIEELLIKEYCEVVKVYQIGPEEHPHYIGVKIRISFENGIIKFSPPGNKVIDVSCDMSLGDKRTLIISKFKTDDSGASL